MNPILVEIYSTILPSAPFVIAAYALMWLILFLYVVFIMFGLKKTEKQMTVLEEMLNEKGI